MDIVQGQRDVRGTFMGGFAGQMVSSGIWAASAACTTWVSFKLGALVLVVGGFFIFPLTQVLLRALGGQGSLPKGHPMNTLGMQVAFTLPLNLPLVYAATVARHSWFYPAFMITLGAHYLPFIFMYGMWEFGGLAAVLIGTGVVIGMRVPGAISLGGWLTAAVLLVFAFVGRNVARKDRSFPGRL